MIGEMVDLTDIRDRLIDAGVPAEIRQVSPGGNFWLYAGNVARTTGPGEPRHAPVLATSGRMAADGHVYANVKQFGYTAGGSNAGRFTAYSSDGTYHLTAAEIAEHIAELVPQVPALAGLCWTCATPIIAAGAGWTHLERDDAGHLPKPRFRTVTYADVWDCDTAAADNYLL